MATDEAHIIEDRALNAWPGVQQSFYDGWILRFSQGFTKRANSVIPLFSGQLNPKKKIRRCQTEYRQRNLQPTFKILPFAQPPHLDVVLEEEGYERIDITSVQTAAAKPLSAPDPAVRTWMRPSSEWVDAYCRITQVAAAQRPALVGILTHIAPAVHYGLLHLEGRPVCCGLGIREEGYLGLFGIATAKGYRRRGFARRLIGHLLADASGTKRVYLQVLSQNEAALNLYRQLGFKESYRYWYRVRAY